ncbi:hypothetical protein JCM3770_007002 [Rhodotorula araucariae]
MEETAKAALLARRTTRRLRRAGLLSWTIYATSPFELVYMSNRPLKDALATLDVLPVELAKLHSLRVLQRVATLIHRHQQSGWMGRTFTEVEVQHQLWADLDDRFTSVVVLTPALLQLVFEDHDLVTVLADHIDPLRILSHVGAEASLSTVERIQLRKERFLDVAARQEDVDAAAVELFNKLMRAICIVSAAAASTSSGGPLLASPSFRRSLLGVLSLDEEAELHDENLQSAVFRAVLAWNEVRVWRAKKKEKRA